MNLEDPHQLINPAQINALCKSAGLPAPQGVKAFGKPSRFLWYGLKWAAGSGVPAHMLRIDLLPNTRGQVIDHVLAAQNTLRMNDEVPSRGDGRRVADNVFGRAAALYRYADLTDGLRLTSMQHSFWSTVAADMGQTLRALADHPVPTFGIRASNGRFLPTRATWREEWQAYVHGLVRGGQSLGLDHGGLTQRVVAAIESRLSALDDVQGFALVHGELRANSLEYQVVDGVPQRANLTGLDLAMQGDPLVEAGFLLTMPPSVLGPVLAAYGHDRVKTWLEPSALARIEAYHLTLTLTRPSAIALQALVLSDLAGLNGHEFARFYAEQALEPDHARRRIEAALEHPDAVSPPDPGPSPHKARTTLRVALATLRGNLVLSAQQAPAVIAGLAAALLGNDLEHEPTYAQPVDGAARTLASAVVRLGLSLGTEPIADRETWRRQLVEFVVGASASAEGSEGTAALMLTWLGLSSVDTLDGTVSDSVLRGLEAAVRELAVQDARDPLPNDILKVQHAAGGRAALVWLSQAFDGLDSSAVGAVVVRLEDRLQDLVDRLESDIPVPSQSFPDETVLPTILAPAANAEQSLTRPFAVHILRTLNGNVLLPTGASSMIKHMGG